MYETILGLHVGLGVLSIISALGFMFDVKGLNKIFYTALAGTAVSGFSILAFSSSSVLWVCIRLTSLLVAAITLKYLISTQFVLAKEK